MINFDVEEDETAVADMATARQPFVAPRATGRRLIQFHEGVDTDQAVALLSKASDTDAAAVRMGSNSVSEGLQCSERDGAPVYLERFGLAAVGGQPQAAAAAANMLAAMDEVDDTRPEFWMFAVEGPPWHDTGAATWGLAATGSAASGYDGAGIRICILDTGLDVGHPDFVGRVIVTESFVLNETVHDVQGHGTHCAGTAAGRTGGPGNVPRYGVAPGADLYVGKVLGDGGSGREIDIVAGIEWAIGNGCEIASMSLGRPVGEGENHDPIYERVARRALEAGTLIIAAAGNESDRRYGYVAPVGSPANAPSIMAVAAIGSDAGIASFSCGGTGHGQIDVAAPGVGVFSSVPRPRMYRALPGTSMACPHVAGIAALWAQSDRGLRGKALWDAVVASAVAVGGLPPRDVGAGLVSAP